MGEHIPERRRSYFASDDSTGGAHNDQDVELERARRTALGLKVEPAGPADLASGGTETAIVAGEIMVRLEEDDFDWVFSLVESCVGWTHWRRAYIATLSVEEPLRRCGLAGDLLEEMLGMLRDQNVTSVSLHVKADNLAAIDFYKKHKFVIIRLLPRHYCINDKFEDALLMARSLELAPVGEVPPAGVYEGSNPPRYSLTNFWWRAPQGVSRALSTVWSGFGGPVSARRQTGRSLEGESNV